MIDLTVGGARFYKTYDVVQMTKRVLEKWNKDNGTAIPLSWINDPADFMERTYPEDEEWTPMLGPPEKPVVLDITKSPNPVILDPDLALLHVEGLERVCLNCF